jgi:hypothetical protein
MSCCMLLLSLTFSSSSELTLCSPSDKIFTFISCHYYIRSQKYHYIHSFAIVTRNTSSSLKCIFLLEPSIMFTSRNLNPGQLSSNQHHPVTLWIN